MQMRQVPASLSPNTAISHTLDAMNLRAVEAGEGGPVDGFVLGLADLWDAVRHLDRAFAVVVKGSGRVGVAAASALVEGRAGLNVGLLLPALRRLAAPPRVSGPDIHPFKHRSRRIVWDIAVRLARVEVPRRLVIKIGDALVHVHACKDGFNFVGGCQTVREFLSAVTAAADQKQPVAYSLGEPVGEPPPAAHPVSALFETGDAEKGALHFADDGWPVAVRSGTSMATLTALTAAVQRLHSRDVASDIGFFVIDIDCRPILSGSRTKTTVALTQGLLE